MRNKTINFIILFQCIILFMIVAAFTTVLWIKTPGAQKSVIHKEILALKHTLNTSGGENKAVITNNNFEKDQLEVTNKNKINKFIRQLTSHSGFVVLSYHSTPLPNLIEFITNTGTLYVDLKRNMMIVGHMINLKTGQDLSTSSENELIKHLSGRMTVQLNSNNKQDNQKSSNVSENFNNQLELPSKKNHLLSSDVEQAVSNESVQNNRSKIQFRNTNLLINKNQQNNVNDRSQFQTHLSKNSKKQRAIAMRMIPDHYGFVFPASGEKKGRIVGKLTVFGRPGCEACHEFYQYTPQLQAAGITVRYIFAPMPAQVPLQNNEIVNVLNSNDGLQLTRAICAKDKAAAFDQLIREGRAPDVVITPTCRKYIQSDIKYIYQNLTENKNTHLTATPLMIADTGKMLQGVPNQNAVKIILNLFKQDDLRKKI